MNLVPAVVYHISLNLPKNFSQPGAHFLVQPCNNILAKFIDFSPLLRCISNMHSWVSTIIIKPSQLAIICLSFSEYVVEAFAFECPPPENIIKIVGVTTVGE